jgi:hypothetical protein
LSIDSPIYYTDGNTAYYGDFSESSKLNNLDVDGITTLAGFTSNGNGYITGDMNVSNKVNM